MKLDLTTLKNKAIGFIHMLRAKFLPVRHTSADTALLIFNPQKKFSDPSFGAGTLATQETAKRICRLTQEFRKAGVPVIVLYTADAEKNAFFNKYKSVTGDTVIGKKTPSGFLGTQLDDVLKRSARKNLLIAGFPLSQDVFINVIEARQKGYDVSLVSDLTGNDSTHAQSLVKPQMEAMIAAGAHIFDSTHALRALKKG